MIQCDVGMHIGTDETSLQGTDRGDQHDRQQHHRDQDLDQRQSGLPDSAAHWTVTLPVMPSRLTVVCPAAAVMVSW